MVRLADTLLIRSVRALVRKLGLDVVRYVPQPQHRPTPPDFSHEDIDTYTAVAPFTMCGPEPVFALCEAVRYVVRNRIPGAIVECGVWKGGSMMAVLRTLLETDDRSRAVYLFDTFEGMTAPSDKDVDYCGARAADLMARSPLNSLIWARNPIEETRHAILSVGYPAEQIHFVKGRVETTIPDAAPAEISVLRLDTDWYESTRHELTHLYPRLSRGGVIIIDDYGHWRGAREATDEYITTLGLPLLLNRVDYTVRIGVRL